MNHSASKALMHTLLMQGITNERVLQAIGEVSREAFVLPQAQSRAYENSALAIDCEQTISQPYIVAHMTQWLLQDIPCDYGTNHTAKILEIGTGSGYQAAILCHFSNEVYTIERIKKLYTQAKKRLENLHYRSIHLRYGDGYLGWPQAAPFDGIIVTAVAPSIPPALLAQLNEKQGRLVIPLSDGENQHLVLVRRDGNQYHQEIIEAVRFVPLKPGIE